MRNYRRYQDLVEECLSDIDELFPWDLVDLMEQDRSLLVVDIREPEEFQAMRIPGSLHVPRGILEPACEYGYEETVPDLVEARSRPIVVVCRSGNRSALAAHTMRRMGYESVYSLKTGLRGWNDYEQPLVDGAGRPVDVDAADEFFTARITPAQLGKGRAS